MELMVTHCVFFLPSVVACGGGGGSGSSSSSSSSSNNNNNRINVSGWQDDNLGCIHNK